jgi:hypothetical protein
MSDDEEAVDQGPENEVPEGVAVFPTIPEELGVSPLLLAVLHATVFLSGSDPSIVQPAAADEAVGQFAEYLQRLQGSDLTRVEEDMACLVSYARQQKWPKGLVQALRTFLNDMGVTAADDEGPES